MGITLENRRLVIAHNPHSTRAKAVRTEVLDRLELAGYRYVTIEVQQASLEDNVARLTPQIQAGDVILLAGGDGSAHAVFHAVLDANQPGVELGFLAFGNFNDAPHAFDARSSLRDPVTFLKQAKPEKVWPLDVFADGKLLRSALLYASLGWTARAAGQFDDPTTRQKLTHGGGGLMKSLFRLWRYYLKTRRSGLLPPFRLAGASREMTDIIFVNGPAIARLFRSGKKYYSRDDFLLRTLDVRRLLTNMPFLISGLVGRMKGEEVKGAVVEFDTPSRVPLQCDGEVIELENVTRIEVKKAARPLVVLTTK